MAISTAAGDRSVSGTSGRFLPQLTRGQAGGIASAFGRGPVISVAGPFAYGRRIVHQASSPWASRFAWRASLSASGGCGS